MDQHVGKRIIVTGSSNAGKSTLAECLASRLGVPYIELDALHWEPGWVEAKLGVFHDRIYAATEPESWVMAGNYLSKQQDVSWPRADTIVFLDLSLPTLAEPGGTLRREPRGLLGTPYALGHGKVPDCSHHQDSPPPSPRLRRDVARSPLGAPQLHPSPLG